MRILRAALLAVFGGQAMDAVGAAQSRYASLPPILPLSLWPIVSLGNQFAGCIFPEIWLSRRASSSRPRER